MNKIKKSHKIIFVSGILLGIILSFGSLFFYRFINQQKNLKREKEKYQLYMEKYVKARGEIERTFSDDPPVTIELLQLERHQIYDFSFQHHVTPNGWNLRFTVTNSSEEAYEIYFQPQMDYLIDGVWYTCSNYDVGSLIEGVSPVVTLLPGESYKCWVVIEDPMGLEHELPYHSGRFWYGHYRVVVRYEEDQFTYMEFDIPEKEVYYSEPLYTE